MTYVLPDLDYDYGALAPHIAPEIMELHHSKHHGGALHRELHHKRSLPGNASSRRKNQFLCLIPVVPSFHKHS